MGAYDQATADLVALDAQIVQADAEVAAIDGSALAQASLSGSAYAAPTQAYQGVGTTGVSKVGPEIDAAGPLETTAPYTAQAARLNTTLQALPTSGIGNAQGQGTAINAGALARQIVAIYRQAIASGKAATTSPAPPNLPPPPPPPVTPPAPGGTATPTTPTPTPAPAPSGVQTATAALGWKAILVAFGAMHPGAAAPASLQWALAQAIGEGSFTGYFRGTNQLGSMHAGHGFATAHASDPGYGMVAFLDHFDQSHPYITQMMVFPSLSLGAQAYLSLIERELGDLGAVGTIDAWSAGLYVHNYYSGFATPRTPVGQRAAALAAGNWTPADRANIDGYSALITRRLPEVQAAIAADSKSDPTLVTSGIFAPLADRLTPGPMYAPHTMEHAIEQLGAAATTPPPGTLSIADCLAPTAGGQGVWMFGGGSATILPHPGGPPATTIPPGGLQATPPARGVAGQVVAGVVASVLLGVASVAIARAL